MKKLLVIALVVATVLGTAGVAGAAFTDVSGPEAAAAEKLADLGIAKGVTDTTFGPTLNVTRAQMAAFIVRSLGLEASATASKGATLFTDVAANHWASGYINVASSMGIIVGYQGKFRPEDPVKFSEAVTMMVRALGYTDADVAALGAWPTGHIAKATELGLLVGVTGFNKDANANRGSIALLLENMVFDAPAKADGKTLAQSVFGILNIASIVVTPATATASIGELKTFTAVGKDAAGANVALEGVVWTVTGNAIIGQDGKFTAYGSGPCVVKATVGDISGTASVHVAGAPAAVKLTLAANPFVANTETTTDLTVEIVDAAGVTVPTAETVINLIISGNGRFKTGGGKVSSTQVTTAEGKSVVKVVSADGVYADDAGNITATTVAGITGAILPYTMVKPIIASISLTPAAGTIEATSGSTVTVTAKVLDTYGVNVPAQVGFTLDLTSGTTTVGAITDPAFVVGNTDQPATFTGTAVPGSATITGAAKKADGTDLGYSVTPLTINTAIAGDAYKLVLKAVTPKTASASTFKVYAEVQDYNGVVKTLYSPNPAEFTLTAKKGSNTVAVTPSSGYANGVLNWDLALTGAGDWALEATHTGSLLKSAGSVTVNPAAASTVVLNPIEPALLSANGTHQAVLTAKIVDTHGNLVTGSTHEVTFERTVNNGAVTLPASLKVSAAGGVATLTVTAGTSVKTDTFRAKVVLADGTTWTSAEQTVSTAIIGLPNNLAVTGLGTANTKAGGSFTVEVSVQDAAPTLVSTDNGRSVLLTITSANASSITVAQNPVTVVNGKATFTLSATKAPLTGIKVKAESTGLIAAPETTLTGTFIANDAAKVKLSVPLAAYETDTCDVPITATAVDAYGNTAAGVVDGIAYKTNLGTLAGNLWWTGTASGTANLADTDGKATVDGVEVPVEGVSVSLYNAGPLHKFVMKPITSVTVANDSDRTKGMLIVAELQDSEGRVKTSYSDWWLELTFNPAQVADAGVWVRQFGTGTWIAGTPDYQSFSRFGTVQWYVTSKLAGSVAFEAGCCVDYVVGKATGTFVPSTAVAVTLDAAPGTIAADGSSISQLTATVVDEFGNKVAFNGSAKWTITAEEGHGRLLSATTSVVNGVAYNTLQSKARDVSRTVVILVEIDINGNGTIGGGESQNVGVNVNAP